MQAAKQNTRVGGWDITLSLPKPPSAMWATASPEMRAEIMQDLVQSARVTMQALHERGVFETRRGKTAQSAKYRLMLRLPSFPMSRTGTAIRNCMSIRF